MTGRVTFPHTMVPHCYSFCLKPIPTKRLLEQSQIAVSNDKDDQLVEETNDAPLHEWGDEFNTIDGPDIPLDVPEGYLVHQSHINVDPGPPDLCELPSKHA